MRSGSIYNGVTQSEVKTLNSSVSPWNNSPALIFWELTRACGLQCKHCRAEAVPDRHPAELSTETVQEHLRQLGDEISGIIVFTGGDAFQRPDLTELVRTADESGLKPVLTPSTTPLLTQDRLGELKEAGLKMVALSLDGPDAFRQDDFRREDHTFLHTLRGIRCAHELKIPLQINTTACRQTYPWIREIGEIVSEADVFRWALFFLVRTGIGKRLESITPEQTNSVFEYLRTWSEKHSAQVKTTNAPHFRTWKTEQGEGSRRPGIVDGDGTMFISHTGEVYPSGFLPESCGNIRERDPLDIYHNHDLFQSIRKRDLSGKCGDCSYRQACGGSRANAYAETGDPLGSDPRCNFDPDRDAYPENATAGALP